MSNEKNVLDFVYVNEKKYADKIWFTQDLTVGIPTVLVCVIFFAGVQMLMLGCMGEYLGRMFLDNSGTPQFVVRYVKRGSADPCTTRTEV